MEETKNEKLDKNTLSIILYFISRLNGVLGKTHLQKLLFLTDLIASKRFQNKMTAIDYKRYLHGPYSSQLDDYTSKLSKLGLVEIKEFPLISDPKKNYIRFYEGKPVDVKQKVLSLLGSEKVLLLEEIAGSFGNMSLREVLEIVYSLEIVKKADMDSPLEMAKKVENTGIIDGEEEEFDFLLE